ncbi:O-antigen ligase family protein [Ruania halotolerans]|uniref:O-antigen ligase family protein n=1 Tax=Ruania halotolerans TaxID=2897773 RepID=UPI001E2C4123|nr:O-antigen ligase family protein [Ruania halotolerans]UFU07263.1 O-antigen ligase family protein [Ruania halotolerans]
MSVGAEPLRGSRALLRLVPLLLVMATAATAGTSTAGPYLAASLLVAAGLVMSLTPIAKPAAKPRTLLVVLHVLIPLQILVTAWLHPGKLDVLVLLGVTILTAWITATEVARRLDPYSAVRVLLLGTAALAVGYLAYAVPRLGTQARYAWVDVATSGQWLNANALALVFLVGLAVALAGMFSETRSALHLVTGALCTGALLLTFSRSGYLALAAMLLVLIATRRRVAVAVAVAVLATPLTLAIPSSVRDRIEFTTINGSLDPSSSARLSLWESSLGIISDMPLLGSGIHALPLAIEQQGGPAGYTFVHNTYLSLLAGFGIPIGLLVLGAVATAWRRRVRALRRGGSSIDLAVVLALTAAAVCSIFGEPLLTPVTIVPLATLLGLREQKEKESRHDAGTTGVRNGRRGIVVRRSGHGARSARILYRGRGARRGHGQGAADAGGDRRARDPIPWLSPKGLASARSRVP